MAITYMMKSLRGKYVRMCSSMKTSKLLTRKKEKNGIEKKGKDASVMTVTDNAVGVVVLVAEHDITVGGG